MEERINYLTRLDRSLRACVSLSNHEQNGDLWMMTVKLFYNGEPAGTTRFNLHGYSREEAEKIATNLGQNPFLMREIDEFLWGESD